MSRNDNSRVSGVNRTQSTNEPQATASPTGRATIQPGIYQGIVKNNADYMGMGRIQVYIPQFGGDPNDSRTWYTVSYMSPHAGNTNPTLNTTGGKSEEESQDSYGIFATGYHPENIVVVSFLSGNPGSGIVMGGMPQQNMTASMGGYGSAPTNQGNGIDLPAVEYNKKDEEVNPREPVRPLNRRMYNQLRAQGLANDPYRGNVTTSPRRDPIPQLSSWKTPRGSFFVIDDGKLDASSGAGDTNVRTYARNPAGGTSMIRLRTEGGAQLLINDDCGFIHITTKSGKSHMTISDNDIQMFTEGTMAFRVGGNLNQRVDKDYSGETLGSTSWNIIGNTNISTKQFWMLSDDDINFGATSVSFKSDESKIQGSDIHVKANGDIIKEGIVNTSVGISQVFSTSPMVSTSITDMDQSSDSAGLMEVQQSQSETTMPDGLFVTHEPSISAKACSSGDPSQAQIEENVQTPPNNMLDLIAQAEGTDAGAGYNETLGYGMLTGGPVDLTSMTLDEVDALQTSMLHNPANRWNSSAVGRYQIVRTTMRGLRDELGLSGSDRLTPDIQDRMATVLLNRRGRSVTGLRNEWQGLNRINNNTILQTFDNQ